MFEQYEWIMDSLPIVAVIVVAVIYYVIVSEMGSLLLKFCSNIENTDDLYV